MPDSSIPPSSNANNSLPPPSPQPSFLASRRLIISAVALLVLIIVVFGLVLLLQPQAIHLGGPSPKQSSTSASPTPTINAQEQAFFASLPQSMLYYSYAQTSNARNVYQSDPTDTHRRGLSVGYPGVNQFVSSLDGQRLIRYTNHLVQIADAKTPTDFKTVYTAGTDLLVTSVKISSNSQQVAIIASQTKDNQSISHLILADTQRSAEMTTITSDASIELVGFIAGQSAWYVEDRFGQLTNLTRFDLTSKQSSQSWSNFNIDQALKNMQYSTDMRFAYLSAKTRLTQFDLSTETTAKTLYEVNTSCPNNKTNDSAITAATVSSTSNAALLQVKFVNCPNQKASLSNTLLLLNTQTSQVVSQASLAIPFTTGFWSVKNDFVWLTIDADTHYIITLATLASQRLPDGDRLTVNKEKLYFLGWLTGVQ